MRSVDYLYAFFIFLGGKGKVESLNNNRYIHQGWTEDVFFQGGTGKGQNSIHLRGKENFVPTLICIALSEVRQINFAPRLRIYVQGVHP